MKRYAFLFSIIISAASVVAQAREPDKIVGLWKSSSQQLMIKIDKVGDHFQGRIVWLGDSGENGMILDENNPNEQLRNLPLKGNKIIQDLTFNPSGSRWEGGTFYSYREGKNYNCVIDMQSSEQLRITKFVPSQEGNQTETWTRQR